MRIVLDSNILVRSFSKPGGLTYQLLLEVLTNHRRLILSSEILAEVTRVLRYPRMMAAHGQDESAIYEFAAWLREGAEFVALNPLTNAQIRDRDDVFILQTALSGEADVLCTIDRDFFEPPASIFLANRGIEVMTDASIDAEIEGLSPLQTPDLQFPPKL